MSGVLVTGATTPLGRAIVLRLADEGTRVIAVGREPKEALNWPDDCERLSYEQIDLRRPRQIRRLLYGPAQDLGINAVVHAPLHRSSRDRGRGVHAINVASTRELLDLAEGHPTIERFVFRSHCEIYSVRADVPTVFGEDHPIDFTPSAPQWLRDRVEADLTVCARMGLAQLSIAVLRASECIGPEIGSQLWDYLRSVVCFRPLGFDPIMNVISIEDLVTAVVCAVDSRAQGVFNIPGADTLPLSAVIDRAQRLDVPLPGPLLRPLYRLRQLTRGTAFRYDLNQWRFHFSGVPDGKRADAVLGYRPRQQVRWSEVPPL